MKTCNQCESDKVHQTETKNLIEGVWTYLYWCKKCWDKEFQNRCSEKHKQTLKLNDQLKEESFERAKWRIEDDGFSVVKLNKKKWYQFWIKSLGKIK